ncbi:MAG: Crp/Fnr family transcriptional regulator [Gammaproteobacteria bacterium]|nr:Crp/Fnr family transcriptional regulator [Gammaproteobacteria bacterium]MCK5262248.1 Crp/Fnr family transcriptional regulator [Gammaproteobacteria bacterium]
MNRNAKTLIEIFETLDAERQASLFDFAEFLQSKGGLVVKEVGDPVEIERPDKETVVGAIKRLKNTYPMIESMTVFSSASELMTDHMVKGRDAIEVIDEMEKIFEDFYAKMLKELS